VIGWRGGEKLGTRSRCFNSGYHDLGLLQVDYQVKSQPEDGPHIGLKHVVVLLLYYEVKYSCVRLYV